MKLNLINVILFIFSTEVFQLRQMLIKCLVIRNIAVMLLCWYSRQGLTNLNVLLGNTLLHQLRGQRAKELK